MNGLLLPVFVINRKEDVERLRWFQEEMSEKWAGQPYEVVEGVLGNKIPLLEFNRIVDVQKAKERNRRDIAKGEVGLILSAQKIYRQILEKNILVAAVFEDDVRLGSRFSKEIDVLQQWVGGQKKATVLILSEASFFRSWCAKSINGTSLRISNPLRIYGAYGYLLNKAAAQFLLTVNTPITYLADDWRGYKKRGLSVFSTLPFLVGNNDFDRTHSTLSAERLDTLRSRELKQHQTALGSLYLVIQHVFESMERLFWYCTGVKEVKQRTNEGLE